MITDEPFKTEGEIHKSTIKEGTYILGRFEISSDGFKKAWSGLFIWINENGYKKAEGNAFEIYHNDFREHPEKTFVVDMYIPIE